MSDHTISRSRTHDFLEAFLAQKEEYNKSPYTIRNYRYAAESFLESAPEDPATWDDTTLVLWLQALRRKGLNDGGRAAQQRHLYPFLRWLKRKRVLTEDITEHVPVITPNEVKRRVATPQDFLRLLAVQSAIPKRADGSDGEKADRLRGVAILHLVRDTGIRRMDIVRLDMADVDQRERELRIRLPKNREPRFVYYSKETKTAIADYIAAERGSDPGPLFMNREGERLTVAGLWSWWRRLRERAGVEVSFHDFRRATASQWIRDGVPAEHVQWLLGHKTLDMTLNVYAVSGRQDGAKRAYREMYG